MGMYMFKNSHLNSKLLVVFLMHATCSIASTNWVLVSGTVSAIEYIDSSALNRNGNVVTAWFLADLSEARPFKGGAFQSLKTQMEFDCATSKFRQIHATLYAGRMGSGTVLGSGYVSNSWEPAIPQSVGETKLKVVCK